MAGKRTRYSAEFKAKVALEALRGELTAAQLAAKHGIHQTMVGEWKRQATEGLAAVFSAKSAASETAKAVEADVEKLHAKIGQLVVERPEIFNTDQGSQFTSLRFTGVLQAAGIRISMDGRGRWMDNVFIERLWRSLKYECVYLHAFETGSELRAGLTKWIGYYNANRPHSGLGGQTPDEAYGMGELMRLAA